MIDINRLKMWQVNIPHTRTPPPPAWMCSWCQILTLQSVCLSRNQDSSDQMFCSFAVCFWWVFDHFHILYIKWFCALIKDVQWLSRWSSTIGCLPHFPLLGSIITKPLYNKLKQIIKAYECKRCNSFKILVGPAGQGQLCCLCVCTRVPYYE